MPKRIKLLHTEWSDGWGGQEIRILEESKAFIEKGYQVIIAARPNSILYSKSIEADIPCVPVKMNKGINIYSIIKFINIIRQFQIQVVHTHSSVDSRLAGIAASICGVKVVRSRHISVPVSKNYLTRWQYMNLADRIITSGSEIRKEMINKNHMNPRQIISAPAGVNTKQFNLDRALVDIRPKYNINKDFFLIGIVSVLRSWKGHKYLIEAIKKLKNKIPEIRLMIVGAGPQYEIIKKHIEQLKLEDYVFLTGHHADPAPFFKAMDVMVLPSYSGEATSQVLPQAMLMKKPVISTNIGGLSEVIINNETGLVVAPKDSIAIANAIEDLYGDEKLRNRLAKNGQEHALTYFTFENMIDVTQSVYQSLIDESS